MTDRIATKDIANIDAAPPLDSDRGQAAEAGSAAQPVTHAPLFDENEGRGFRARWDGIQTGFVDEPRTAVEQADTLVAEMMKRLAEVFANERASLEKQWSQGDKVSTEELRIALKRYRSFFERLLSV